MRHVNLTEQVRLQSGTSYRHVSTHDCIINSSSDVADNDLEKTICHLEISSAGGNSALWESESRNSVAFSRTSAYGDDSPKPSR